MQNSWLQVVMGVVVALGPVASAATHLTGIAGTAGFAPSVNQPVGWRGDGSGRYPGANPPTIWGNELAGNGYTTKGILWMTLLANNGVSSPIIVGERIFLTSE